MYQSVLCEIKLVSIRCIQQEPYIWLKNQYCFCGSTGLGMGRPGFPSHLSHKFQPSLFPASSTGLCVSNSMVLGFSNIDSVLSGIGLIATASVWWFLNTSTNFLTIPSPHVSRPNLLPYQLSEYGRCVTKWYLRVGHKRDGLPNFFSWITCL